MNDKLLWIAASFITSLSIGLLGFLAFDLLPAVIKNRIERFHEDE
jgi:hypothetical protein